ncbi:RNA-directed DNA polymerase, eukaryota, reverse transcriptase zinc-binding domain protein [Tanacetum coccineum]
MLEDFNMVKESTINVNVGKQPSFASMVASQKAQTKANFRRVEVVGSNNGEFEAMIPVSSVLEVNERLSNSIYGYFIGKRIAFPVVENYVFNAWGKYEIHKIMMNAKGFYFFKFSSEKGVEDGRSSYARAMIEITFEVDPKESVVIAIPNLYDEGYKCVTVNVEYEWKPPCRHTCNIFGHSFDTCPKTVKEAPKRAVENLDERNTTNTKKGKENNIKTSNAFFVLEQEGTSGNNGGTGIKVGKIHEDKLDVQEVSDSKDGLKIFMMKQSIASWNIRGMNRTPKQKEVCQVITDNYLNVCAVLEYHVDIGKLERICTKVCVKWKWVSNASVCQKGSRIILGWNDDIVDLIVLSFSSQDCLNMHKHVVYGRPWVIMEDFNAALFTEYTYHGSKDINISMREFNECVTNIEVEDVNSTSLHYTWT